MPKRAGVSPRPRFGPKGFASAVYGLLVLQAGIPEGRSSSTFIAVTIALSIILHSSTDVPVAHKSAHPSRLIYSGRPGT